MLDALHTNLSYSLYDDLLCKKILLIYFVVCCYNNSLKATISMNVFDKTLKDKKRTQIDRPKFTII